MSNPAGLAMARQLIDQEAQQRTGFLDLGNLGLTELPEEIHQLKHLRGLNLGRSYFDQHGRVRESANRLEDNNDFSRAGLAPLYGLTSLKSLHCSHRSVSDLTLLSGVKSLQLLDCSDTSVSNLAPLSALSRLHSLDCSRTPVSDLSPVSGLTSLRSLVCSNTSVSDLTPLSGLTNLQSLNCGATSVSDLTPLSGVTSLQKLNCYKTSVRDLTPLSGLLSLQSLSCGTTSVSDLTPLSGLTDLQSLSCIKTKVRDLTPLSGLTSLQSLSCQFTSVSDLTRLSGLTNLQSLDCFTTKVSDLAPLSTLTKLQSLKCHNTPVSDLTPLSGLTSLRLLDCSETSVSDLTPLSGLTSLQSLDCHGTSVSNLTPLSGLTTLTKLEASRCTLKEFPRALLDKHPPMELRLFETRIPGVPAEVLSQDWNDECRQRLLDHVNDLEAGAEPVSDVKVIVIGNGRIGKTQICNRLRGEPFEENADSTHGILVKQAELPMPGEPQPALLNLWDFGGQDLYHGTHALFLKSRALFVVVWTPLAENDREYEFRGLRFRNQPLAYWLDYVRHAAGNVCPVVLVQNQCDTPRDEAVQPPAPPEALRGLSYCYLQQVHYSAKEDRKRDSLNESLREAIRHLRGQEGIATIGRGRMNVRRQLQRWLDEDAHRDPDRRQHRTLTQPKFRQLCADVGDVSSPDSLLDYLHNAGIVFYRPGLFHDEIVLDQGWALDAIYTVFNREQCYRQLTLLDGRFTRSLLEALVWPLEKYSRAEQELFLSLMTSCGICFVHFRADESRQIEVEYVAPDLLPDRARVAPQLAGRWDESAEKCERAWRFEFLSPSVVRSLISAVGRKAGECAVYWKYGVWFYDATTRASAVIEECRLSLRESEPFRGAKGDTHRIVLQTQGDRGGQLLEAVTEWIEETIRSGGGALEGKAIGTGFRPEEIHPHGFEARTASDKPAAAIHITNPPRPADERRACVSYAWKEERSEHADRAGKVEAFCQQMAAAGRKVVRDTHDLPLYGQISKFMLEAVGHADRVFVFLSDAYLKSPNCMSELHEIWRYSGSDGTAFSNRIRVFPMPGMANLRDPRVRLEYADHWEAESKRLERLVQEKTSRVSENTFSEYARIRDLPGLMDVMLATISDRLLTGNLEMFIAHAISELK